MAALRLEEVSKRFGAMVGLQAVSLAVQSGEVVAVVGGNGAGKTTMLLIAAGLVAADSGEVFVAGRRMPRWLPSRIYRGPHSVAAILQRSRVVKGKSAGANIALGDPNARRGVLRSVFSTTRKSPQTEGYTVAGVLQIGSSTDAARMSPGQQRSLELARLRVAPRALVLLDDQTRGDAFAHPFF